MQIDANLWTLQVCGNVSVSSRTDRYDRFPTRRSASLLSALALTNGSEFERENLCQVLWPDELNSISRTLLRNELVRLKKALGGAPSYLQSSKSKIWLNTNEIRLDLDIAEQAILNFDPLSVEAPNLAVNILRSIESPVSSVVPVTIRDVAERRRQKLFRTWLILCSESHLEHGMERGEYFLELALEHSPQSRKLQQLIEKFQVKDLSTRVHNSSLSDDQIPNSSLQPIVEIRYNIPQVLMPLYGRSQELENLLTSLNFEGPNQRLISIRAMGGMGKTRLAIEVANSLKSHLNERVWFVDASNSVDQNSFLNSICDQLEINQGSAHRTIRSLSAAIGPSPSLLIIDNCEQLDQSSIQLVEELVESHSTLKVLCTTRRRLGIRGEKEIELFPVSHEAATKIYLHNYQSDIDPSEIQPLIELLDGIPLAIQLASAYREILSPKDSVQQLEKRFTFLVDPAKILPERHQRLWDTIDWSVQLLDDECKHVLMCLTVFNSDWSIEAAEQIIDIQPIYRSFERLVANSLITITDSKLGRRFTWLESVRGYCESQLDTELKAGLAKKHFEYFLKLVQDKFGSRSVTKYYEESRGGAVEYQNIRSAIQFGIDHQDPRVIEVVHLLGRYWLASGKLQEGLYWYEQVTKLPIEPTVDSLGMYFWAGSLAKEFGTFDKARFYFEKAIEIGQAMNNVELTMIVRGRLAELLMIEGQYRKSNQLSYECLEVFETIGGIFNQTFIYEDLALSHCALGETAKAIAVANLCYETRMKSQHGPLTQGAYRALGRANFEQGELIEARYYLEKARDILKEESLPIPTCRVLEDIALLEIELGNDRAFAETLVELENVMETHANDADIARAKFLLVLAESMRLDSVHAAMTLIDHQTCLKKATMPVLLDTLDTEASLFAKLGAKDLAKELDGLITQTRKVREIPRTPGITRIVDRTSYESNHLPEIGETPTELFNQWTSRLGALVDEIKSRKVS